MFHKQNLLSRYVTLKYKPKFPYFFYLSNPRERKRELRKPSRNFEPMRLEEMLPPSLSFEKRELGRIVEIQNRAGALCSAFLRL